MIIMDRRSDPIDVDLTLRIAAFMKGIIYDLYRYHPSCVVEEVIDLLGSLFTFPMSIETINVDQNQGFFFQPISYNIF